MKLVPLLGSVADGFFSRSVTNFGTMEFGRFLELFDIGISAGKKLLDDFDKKGMLPTGMEGEVEQGKVEKRGQSVRRNSI